MKRLLKIFAILLVTIIVLTGIMVAQNTEQAQANGGVTFRSYGDSGGANSGTCVIAKPAGLAVGDLMIAQTVFNPAAAIVNITTEDGWASIRRDDEPPTARFTSALFWKIADADDVAATNFTFTSDQASNNSNRGTITAWYGHDSVTPINANNGQGNAASTTVTSPTITPSVANCMILLFCGIKDNNTQSGYAITTNNPASWSEAYDLPSDLTADLGLSLGYALRPETSATGSGTATTSGSDINIGQLVAIAPSSVVPPTMTTQAASDVEETTATGNGNITVTSENCTRRGFCYKVGTSGDPTTADSTAYDDGSFGTGPYTKGLTGLTPGESYRVRAYAVNSGGTGYGTTVQMYTKCNDPTALDVTSQTSTTISLSWTKGTGAEKTLVMYKTTGYPANTGDGTQAYFDTGSSTIVNTPLSSGQIYYFRAWAWDTNTSYSDGYVSVTDYTLPANPSELSAVTADNITINLTWTKGTGGDKTMIRSKVGSYPASYDTDTEVYFDTDDSKSDTPLVPGTAYYYRAWAYDSDSGYYSSGYSEANATTQDSPSVITVAATLIKKESAQFNGNITSVNGINADYRGFVWDTASHGDPGDVEPISSGYSDNSSESGSFESGTFNYTATLNSDTTYYFRAYAHNDYGWAYGDELTFDTLSLSMWYQANTIIQGDILPDRAGNNDGVITWGANAENITANMVAFSPTSLATVSDDEAQTWGTMTTTPPSAPPSAYSENTTPGIFFRPLVAAIATASGMPESLFWYNFAFIIIITAGMLTFWFFAKNNQTALLIKCIVMGVLMAFFAMPGPNIYGFYVVIYFAFWCFGIMILSKHYGW